MKLRKLENKDAALMLSWMHNKDVVSGLGRDFFHMPIADCKKIIETAQDTTYNLQLAIVDDNDLYQGIFSLKYLENGQEKFAIVVQREGLEHSFAMKKVYCKELSNDLGRSIFYDENGYECVLLKNVHLSCVWSYRLSYITSIGIACRSYDTDVFSNRFCESLLTKVVIVC